MEEVFIAIMEQIAQEMPELSLIDEDYGQLEAALFDLEEVLKLDSQDASSYVMKGDICLELKKKSEAREAYEKAMALGIPRVELADKWKQCK